MSNSNPKRKPKPKPRKPRRDFPLTAHPNGQWRKVCRGKAYYFGPWADPEGAERLYHHEWPYIVKGLSVPPMPHDDDLDRGTGFEASEFVTLAEVLEKYLQAQRAKLDNRELSPRTYADAMKTRDLILAAVDGNRDIESIGPDDFAKIRKVLSGGGSLVVLGVLITRVRSVMKFAVDTGMREKAIHYGQSLARPTRKAVRRERSERPEKFFTADECRTLIAGASLHLKPMILLALNAGLGNTDIGSLRLDHLDLDAGVVATPRPKTGAPRRAILWPDTVKALRASLAERPAPHADAERLAFVTKYGKPWVRREIVDPADGGAPKLSQTDAVSGEFRKLLKATDLQKDRRAFYSLRHSFRTIADSLADRPAVDLVMGHEDHTDMRGHYVASNRIGDDRLKAVADHVRAWLYPPKPKRTRKGAKPKKG